MKFKFVATGFVKSYCALKNLFCRPIPLESIACVPDSFDCIFCAQCHSCIPMDALAAVAADARPLSPPPDQRLTELERWSIVALHNDGRSKAYIAESLKVHRNTVRDVLRRWRVSEAVHSGSRRGRPRCTDEATDTAIAFTARVDVFTSPRQIKRKLYLEASISTIDRRLQQAGLFGRVAAHS